MPEITTLLAAAGIAFVGVSTLGADMLNATGAALVVAGLLYALSAGNAGPGPTPGASPATKADHGPSQAAEAASRKPSTNTEQPSPKAAEGGAPSSPAAAEGEEEEGSAAHWDLCETQAQLAKPDPVPSS
jgi:hypothetical protein